jgi:uncharacterized membrane protein
MCLGSIFGGLIALFCGIFAAFLWKIKMLFCEDQLEEDRQFLSLDFFPSTQVHCP